MLRALSAIGSATSSHAARFSLLVLAAACGGEVGERPGSGTGATAGSEHAGGAAGAGAAPAGGAPTNGSTGGGTATPDAPLACTLNVEVPEANRDACPDEIICAEAALLVFPSDECGGAPLGYWRVTLDGAGLVLWVEGEGVSTEILICARLALGDNQFPCLRNGAVWQDM